MNFTGIKVVGFKSFVEPTTLVIEQGLTGIVGPNGCGKSNVVESLRWAMGENSAKRLRGGDMDDVIFSGSAGRPARNLAEVTILLDNAQRTALAEFNNDDAIEVTRRIERGMGSDYRINGRPVRQKDVQLLFADQATGAHSTSIVSQGRISALIQAKPTERRQVLEEAAGISGLHARRHEAELKLKGAEGNLTRVDDQLQVMDGQLRGLKTQVRQASRYRNLGELIRKAEGGLLYLKAKQAEVNVRLAEDNYSESEGRVRELTSLVANATTLATEHQSTLPPLRHAEAAASAVVQRLVLERETVVRDIARIAQEQAQLEQRIEQNTVDQSREETLANDAQEALARLQQEEGQLHARIAAKAEGRPALEENVRKHVAIVDAQDKALHEKTDQLAHAREQMAVAARERGNLETRRTALQEKAAQAQAQLTALEEELAHLPSLALALSLVEACEKDLVKKRDAAEATLRARTNAESALVTLRDAAQKSEVEKTKLQAEADALEALLRSEENTGTPLSDLLRVEPGYEAALAAALSDTLAAPLESGANIFWQDLGALNNAQDLPNGAEALTKYVEAPGALGRALSQIGLVANNAGESLAKQLKPGQILVSREGGAWRWDGYTQRADAITPAAARLQQRNRLAELKALIGFAAQKAATAAEALANGEKALATAQADDQHSQAALQQAFAALSAAQKEHATQAQAQAQHQARLESLRTQRESYGHEQAEIDQQMKALDEAALNLPDTEALANEVQNARVALAEQRHNLSEAQSALNSHQRDMDADNARASACQHEILSWQARGAGVAKRLEELKARQGELEAARVELAAKPEALEEQKQQLLTQGSAAEETRVQAADALQTAETLANELNQKMRSQEQDLAQAKEGRVRTEEHMNQARRTYEELTEKIRHEWHVHPDELLAKIEVAQPSDLPPVTDLENDFARYTRERDGMGPVNLRAEMEAGEIDAAIGKMTAEKEDLVSAIAKLRQGIGELNKEARDRLQTAFDDVNKNFSNLFTQMFGGGKAHLELIESDDPLDAGLEIYASPPGKRLQALSLLSGGEQALTALSLLFAIFLVNPSPICVLDEVDAPLDEANVDRYCSLLRQMADQGRTRFLIITHHRLTMARMDRLYGVTMAEKGVSQLVSVDLKQAVAMREQNPESASSAAHAA